MHITRQMDGQTNMTMLIIAFHSFENVPTNVWNFTSWQAAPGTGHCKPPHPQRTAPLPNALGTGWFGHGASKNVLVPAGSQTAAHNYSHFTMTSLSWCIQCISKCIWVEVFPPVPLYNTICTLYFPLCVFSNIL